MNLKHLAGPPMTLGNMREQGVHHLIAFCLNHAWDADADEFVAGLSRSTWPAHGGWLDFQD